jgi:hypothetical protein
MEILNKKQVRIYLGNEALALASSQSEISGKNFSQTIEDLILNGSNKKKKEADNAKSKNNSST